MKTLMKDLTIAPPRSPPADPAERPFAYFCPTDSHEACPGQQRNRDGKGGTGGEASCMRMRHVYRRPEPPAAEVAC